MNLKQTIRDFLKTDKLITDGAFGTYFSSICQAGIFPERANTEAGELVRRVHEAYLKAGARLIRTNTFASNTQILDSTLGGVLENVREAFLLAKQAVADCAKSSNESQETKPVYIAGDIGPIPYKQQEDEDLVREEYLAIARQFVELGADALVFETFADTDIIFDVMKQLRAESDIFIITQFSVNQLGYSNVGISAKSLFEEAKNCEAVDALGFNCGVGPGHMAGIVAQLLANQDMVKQLADAGKYLTALPNASYPKLVQDRIVFLENMEYFTEKLMEIADMGVSIIGGCCGTNPDYIRKVVKAAEQGEHFKAGYYTKAAKGSEGHIDENTRKSRAELVSDTKGSRCFLDAGNKRAGEKLIAVELSPPPSAKDAKLLEAAHLLEKYKVDVVSFPDSPSGRTRADSILMAAKVARETNLCVMPHICCRDKNAIAMRSQLLGAHLSEIRNLLIITGDPIPSMVRSGVTGVFNFDSVGLMKIVHEMNKEQFDGDSMHYGGAINQNRRNLDVEIRRVQKKMMQGAEFFLTQPIFTQQEAERVKQVKEETGACIFCGIMPLISRKNALFIQNEMAGIQVTDEIVKRYDNAESREEGEQVGIALARDVMELTSAFADGYYFSIPFNRVYLLEEILR